MLPPELQQVPISFPFAGKPQTYATVNVPMAFKLTVPSGLAGTRAYSATLPTLNPVFTLNRISGDQVTHLGDVTITPASTTSIALRGRAARSMSATCFRCSRLHRTPRSPISASPS